MRIFDGNHELIGPLSFSCICYFPIFPENTYHENEFRTHGFNENRCLVRQGFDGFIFSLSQYFLIGCI